MKNQQGLRVSEQKNYCLDIIYMYTTLSPSPLKCTLFLWTHRTFTKVSYHESQRITQSDYEMFELDSQWVKEKERKLKKYFVLGKNENTHHKQV